MKNTEKQPDSGEEKPTVEYTNAFLLNGKTLQPFTTDADTAAKITQDKQSLEKKFKTETELAEIVLNNGKILFGEKTVLIDCLKKKSIEFSGGFTADGMLFDFSEEGKTKFYLIEILLSSGNLGELFMRMTHLFSLFRTKESGQLAATKIADAINRNIGWRNKFKPFVNGKKMDEFLQEILNHKPSVLLVMDSFKQELSGFMETYTETWGKYLKPMALKKFAINGNTVFTITPKFIEINGKKNDRIVKEKSTEEDHLEEISETVKEIFLEIKSELQKVNIDVEFRVKQHYISLRKNRNLAFFQLGKKKLSIVIANPEKNMQKQIKHHQIRTLAESVKKFWNGNEHCFTVVIERNEHLNEITSLMKKLIEEKPESDVSAEKSETSQAKPKRKSKK